MTGFQKLFASHHPFAGGGAQFGSASHKCLVAGETGISASGHGLEWRFATGGPYGVIVRMAKESGMTTTALLLAKSRWCCWG
jgi:hypothetical protein